MKTSLQESGERYPATDEPSRNANVGVILASLASLTLIVVSTSVAWIITAPEPHTSITATPAQISKCCAGESEMACHMRGALGCESKPKSKEGGNVV